MHVYRTDPVLFNELADILKVLAHPQRLCIVKTLCEKGQSNVTDMQDCLDEAQSNISQHLSKLKSVGIVVGRREGTSIFYSISNKRMKNFIKTITDEFFNETIL